MGSTSEPEKGGYSRLHSPLYWLYEHLTRGDQPRPVELIFVLAGRMERKRYGMELYRAGLAPRLLLSVGRFEVSRMGIVDFEGADELIAQRNQTAPEDRHFFCEISAAGIRTERPMFSPWNTYGEIGALRKFVGHEMPRSMMIVSTDVHLRRIAIAVDEIFRDAPIEICYCPVPPGYSSLRKHEWWRRPQDRRYVLWETMKLASYRAILSLPEPLIQRIMRLKGDFHVGS